MSFHLSKFWLLFWLSAIFIWPVAAYFLSYYQLVPKMIGEEVAEMAAELQTLSEVELDNTTLKNKNIQLEETLAEERKYRAEAEARVAIVENARANAATELQQAENKIFELKNRLGFYSALMEKSSEKLPLQCFNIQQSLKGEKLSYKVNFMLEDIDNKDQKEYKVKFRVIGASNLSMEEVEKLPSLQEREIKLRRDIHIEGDLKVAASQESLRILDIRAYDKADKLAARCWKAF